jgi:hypothetical protein
MSNASGEMHKTRIISELKGFIRKLLQDPKILEQSLIVARARLKEGAEQGQSEAQMLAIIANDSTKTATAATGICTPGPRIAAVRITTTIALPGTYLPRCPNKWAATARCQVTGWPKARKTRYQ